MHLLKQIIMINNIQPQIKNSLSRQLRFCSGPDSLHHMLWSLLITLIVLFFVIQSTLVAFFESTRAYIHLNMTIQYSVLIAVLSIDIAVSFRRGVYIKGVLHQEIEEVARHYFKWKIYVDIMTVSVLFTSIFVGNSLAALMRLIIFVRLIDVARFDELLFRRIHTRRNLKQLYQLIKLILGIVLVSHLVGCMFYLMDRKLIQSAYFGPVELYPQRYWLTSSAAFSPIMEMDDAGQYLYAMYFGVATVTTLTCSDVAAMNPAEAALALVFTIFTTITFALALEQIVDILKESGEDMYAFLKELNTMVYYMKVKRVSSDIQLKVRSFFYFLWYQNQIRNESAEETIIQKLPKTLKHKLWLHDYGKYISTVQVFACMPKQSLIVMLEHASEVIYAREDTIADPYSNAKQLIFIQSGSFRMYFQTKPESSDQKTPKVYTSKAPYRKTLNIAQFITGFGFGIGFQCQSETRAIIIDRQKAMPQLKKNSQADVTKFLTQEVIQQAYNQILIQKNFKPVRLQCYICSESTHTALYCPRAHYVFKHKLQRGQPNQRIPTFSRRQTKTNKMNRQAIQYLKISSNQNQDSYLMKYYQAKQNQFELILDQLVGDREQTMVQKMDFEEVVNEWEHFYRRHNIQNIMDRLSK